MDRESSKSHRTALQRTKSAASVHVLADRVPTSRMQAETAACEAYRRSRQHEITRGDIGSRSLKKSRFEGSHFEDARLGRRRSMNNTIVKRRPGLEQTESQHQYTRLSPGCYQTSGASIPPKAASQKTSPQHVQLTTHGPPTVQSSTTVTAQGSPTPRRKPVPASTQSTLPPSHHVQQFSYEIEPSNEHLSIVGRSSTKQLTEPDSYRPRAQSSLFQSDKVRNRKSFLLGSVQKLRKRSSAVHNPGAFNRDKSVPPFNLAGQGLSLPPPAVDDAPDIAHFPVQSTKARSLSFAVRDRIRQLIKRPASRSLSDLPPQHIPAKQAHYSFNNPTSTTSSHGAAPNFCSTPQDEQLRTRTVSTAIDDEERSRVTSWTNSTITQTTGTQSALGHCDQRTEHGMLTRSSHSRRLKNRASFFGRSVNNKLRKTSRAELSTSQESQGLYAALQNFIYSSTRRQHTSDGSGEQLIGAVGPDQIGDMPPTPTTHTHLLPQTRAAPTSMSSVRVVTPDQHDIQERAMSPLTEVASPVSNLDLAAENQAYALHISSTSGLKSQTEDFRPSPERLAQRLKQSQDRWQDALAGTHHRPGEQIDNPYELSAIESRMITSPIRVVTSLQPRDASPPNQRASGNALSPSIYSRTSQGSIRILTPDTLPETSITITGREVRSYKISPAKAERSATSVHPVKASSEWRRWLSGEFRELSNAISMTKPPQTCGRDVVPTSESTQPPVAVDTSPESSDTVANSHTHAVKDIKTLAKSRPAASGRRRSSFMNERYPTIASSRSSSRQSGQRSRTSVATARSGSMQAEGPHSTRATQEDAAVGRHKSLADMVNELRAKSAVGSKDDSMQQHDDRWGQNNKLAHRSSTSLNEVKHLQSSTELRARFKSSLSENSRPVDIRRKSVADALILPTDDTLRKISAGPYAADVKFASAVSMRENTLPVKPAPDSLPALSSSEWLAGPPLKQRESFATANDVTSSSAALSASQAASRVGKTPSPGHKLATGWLKERSHDGHGAAFV